MAPVLAHVVATSKFHGGHELGTVLSLVALNHVRGQRARDQMSMGLSRSMRQKIADGQVSPEQWDKLVEAEIRAGVHRDFLPSFADAQRLVLHQNWLPKAPEVLKVGLIGELHRAVFEILADRDWCLAVPDDDAGFFVCSDTPLSWSDDPHRPARLNDKSKVLAVPLAKRLTLVTLPQDRRRTYRFPRALMARINSRTSFFSLGKWFWDGAEFLLGFNCVGTSAGYFEFYDEARKRGIERP